MPPEVHAILNRKAKPKKRTLLSLSHKKRERIHIPVYVLFHCDAWQSYASMRFIGVVTEKHLDKTLRKIKRECGYSEEDMEKYVFIREATTNDLQNMDI